ncbi:MAG: nitroreductase family protein [Candidatus Lokiarchaeota archaeon]|nr:nitroreductase family protein [Candidatus Lokiarchaeota archaeon]
MMDFYEVIKKRRSYRIFKREMPTREQITRIINSARLAPTWANMQGMHYVVVQDPDIVKLVWDAIGQYNKFADAPMYIVGCIAEKGSGTNINGMKYYSVDFGICFEHIILAATAEGLGTCWIGYFNENEIKKALQIPEEFRVLGLTPLGYPAKTRGEVEDRRSLEEIMHFEKF